MSEMMVPSFEDVAARQAKRIDELQIQVKAMRVALTEAFEMLVYLNAEPIGPGKMDRIRRALSTTQGEKKGDI